MSKIEKRWWLNSDRTMLGAIGVDYSQNGYVCLTIQDCSRTISLDFSKSQIKAARRKLETIKKAIAVLEGVIEDMEN